jgi:hypothetical protein
VGFEANADPEQLDSGAHSIKVAAEYSAEYYKKYGYRYSRKGNCFVKKQDGFYHKAELSGSGYSIAINHSICITKGLHLVSHVGYVATVKPESACCIFVSETRESYTIIWPDVEDPFRRDSNAINVNSVSEVKSAMDKIMLYEEQTFMPLWNQIQTLENVHTFLNTPGFEPLWKLLNGNQFAQLLIAYLAKVENLDSLIGKLRASLPDNPGAQWIHPIFEKTAELIQLEARNGSA